MKKFIILTILVLVLLIPLGTICYAEDTTTTTPQNDYFVEVTKAQVYHESGRIYIATQYYFNPNAVYKYTVDGEEFTLDFNKIILVLKQIYESQKIEYIFNDNTPNNLIKIDKVYSSRTELNHEQGITGDEIYEPLDKASEDFWFTTYINKSNSYLANGGKQSIEKGFKELGLILFSIDNVDLTRVKFNYVYGTDYKSITTNGRMVKMNNMYYHIFENINEESEIILYQKVQNSANWYGVIIGTSVGVLLLGFLGYVIFSKRRKNG